MKAADDDADAAAERCHVLSRASADAMDAATPHYDSRAALS